MEALTDYGSSRHRIVIGGLTHSSPPGDFFLQPGIKKHDQRILPWNERAG
jgi:hypothetical protein